MLNIEVKGNLARLLAAENLIVEHRQVETASFDVKNRVLTLPMWERASANVYDLLVGHEVGHAIYTPDKWGDDYGIPPSYLNVCEDARIEKLMKRKFPGLARNFYAGYKELSDKDFFSIGERTLASFAFIDRINLYFKVGIHAGEVFEWNDEEKVMVDELANSETWDEVVDVARKILAYTKQQEEEKVANAKGNGETEASTQDGGDTTPNVGEDTPDDGMQSGGKSEGQSEDNQTFDSSSGNLGSEMHSETDKAFTDNQQQLINQRSATISYVELPLLNVQSIVIDNQQVMRDCVHDFGEQPQSLFEHIDKAYYAFRSEAQREVNYLVKEFEMRKSADQYARASTAKTGILDTQKLYTYKWNEDVFKKISVVPDGKNHGLIFILDWSGSMGSCLEDTAKQILNLAWFCKKVQIPFDLYSFTSDYRWHTSYNYDTGVRSKSRKHCKEITGQVNISEHFNLLNMVSSNGRNGKDLEAQLKNFWRLVQGYNSSYTMPTGYSLSGTPLNEAVISLTAIIPDFQKRNKVQKTNVVILTDGEAQSIDYFTDYIRYGQKLGTRHISDDCVLRDRQTGRVYPRFAGGYYSQSKITGTFLRCVRDRYPDVNLIGIRLISGRHLSSVYEDGQSSTPYTEVQKQWKKTKTAELINFNGYQSLYVMSSNSLSSNSEFSVDEDATTKQIGTAFTTSLSKKGVNKKMLTSFATLIS